MDEDPISKNAQGISKSYHEVLMLMKVSQTKPQVKKMIFIFYELYYTVVKDRDATEILDNQNENDYIIFKDIFPNHYSRRKNDNEIIM